MTVAKQKEREQQENALLRWFRDTRQEVRKVVWPSREETVRLTIVVIVVSAAIGTILFLGDSLFLFLYTLLIDAVQ